MAIRWWGAVGLALAAIGVPVSAGACDCATPESWDYSWPADDAADVPTNARVFVPPSMLAWSPESSPAFFWKAADGTPIAFEVASLGDFVVLVPKESLAPSNRYTAGVVGRPGVAFRTGEGPDSTPPAVPEILEVGEGEVSTGTSCGDEAYVPMVVRSEEGFLLLDLGAASAFDPVTLAGAVDEVQPGGERVYFWIGEAACAAPNAKPGETVRVRFAALDGAGNLSDWTASRRIEVPDYGCGCRSAGPGDLGLLAFGLVALALRRRR